MVEQNLINHVGLILDASYSMLRLADKVIDVADKEVAALASRSTELDQETRATVYDFSEDIRCLYYDKDVLRLPSLKGKYRIRDNTALIDATMQGIEDLEKTATLYGDHAFLIYVLTDGQENHSRKYRMDHLQKKLFDLPDNWTIACLVPNNQGMLEASRYGFLSGNIAIWDATRTAGLDKAASVVRTATDNWMQARAQGVRGTANIFTLDPGKANVDELQTLQDHEFIVYTVDGYPDIREFFEAQTNKTYKPGLAYYQLTKTEDIQAQKKLYIRNRITGKIYGGPKVRGMLGLPSEEVKVHPAAHPDYDIFIQSTSYNRKLMNKTGMLVVK